MVEIVDNWHEKPKTLWKTLPQLPLFLSILYKNLYWVAQDSSKQLKPDRPLHPGVLHLLLPDKIAFLLSGPLLSSLNFSS